MKQRKPHGAGIVAQIKAAPVGAVLWFDDSPYLKTIAYRAGKSVAVEWCWAVGIRSGTTSKVMRMTILGEVGEVGNQP